MDDAEHSGALNGEDQAEDEEGPIILLSLTPGEVWSLLMQYKDRDLGTADRKLADAYKDATGKPLGL